MDYYKIAERLVRYKLYLGETNPYFQKKDFKFQEDYRGRVYYLPVETQMHDKAWTKNLELIVSMRHSKIGIVRKLSRKESLLKK